MVGRLGNQGAVMNERGRLLTVDIHVRQLRKAIANGGQWAAMVPAIVKAICPGGAWRHRIDEQTGERWDFEDDEPFESFVTGEFPRGLCTTVETLEKLCRDDPEAEAALEEASQRPPCLHAALDNIQGNPAPTGTSRQRALRKLRQEAERSPEVAAVYARVLAGELSPHRGMVECGFRQVPTPLEAAQRAWAKLSDEEKSQFLDWAKL